MHFINELLACARVTKMSEVLALSIYPCGKDRQWTRDYMKMWEEPHQGYEARN